MFIAHFTALQIKKYGNHIMLSTPILTKEQFPDSVWKDDSVIIPIVLSKAHREILENNLNLWKDYLDHENGKGSIGGDDEGSAVTHFVYRFLNSAARCQYVCSDPKGEQVQVREAILDQLGEGNLFILDLAAGNGAGTLAILSLIFELRSKNLLPTWALNVTITAVDYSSDALQFYDDTLNLIIHDLETQGIKVTLNVRNCDLKIPASFGEILEDFFDDAKAKKIKRFLCIISAITGVKKHGFMQIHESFKLAATGLASSKRNSTWVWIEPAPKKNWHIPFANEIMLLLKKLPFVVKYKGEEKTIETTVALDNNPTPRSFKWVDPHKNCEVKSDVVVVEFKNG